MTKPESNSPAGVRLQKLLSGWGLASRRTVEEWIAAGRIRLNGRTVREQGVRAQPGDRVEVDGQPVQPPILEEKLIFAFHKPPGVISTLEDTHDRQTLQEFLPPDRRVYPIGRLDQDTSGLLLLTDHGELTNRLLHPRYKVEKEYEVHLIGRPLTEVEQKKFSAGIILDDGITHPCTISQKNPTTFSVVLREGRKRQIRRMFQALGRKVDKLCRVRFGPVLLGSLQPGKLRKLTPVEVEQILKLTQLRINS